MKVVYLPIGQQPGTEDAFRKFADLRVLDYMSCTSPNEKLTALVREFKPDLVHMQLQMTNKIHVETVARLKREFPQTVFTNWTGDIRSVPCKNFINMSKAVDWSLMSNVGQIELYRGNGCRNPAYWQIGYDPKIYFPKKQNRFKYDVAFVGSNYGRTFPDSRMRSKIAERLKERYKQKTGVFGSGYRSSLKIKGCSLQDTNNIYNDSLCVVSISNFNDVSHYFSDRMLMCLASGRPTISYRFPGSDSYFTDRGDYLVAYSEQDVFRLVEECKENLAWANEIGRNGHLRVLSEHTFESRILELFSITGLLGKIGVK